MRKHFCLYIIAALLMFTGAAFAQSGGSGGGSFSNAFLIPTVLCQAGSNSLGSTGATACGPAASGGRKVLFADFKVSSSERKELTAV